MTAKTILAFLFLLTLRTAAQEAPEPQRQAQCNFSDGRTITVTYSSERREYRLATDEDLVTVKGIGVPSGDYSVFPAKDSHNNWTLRMRKQTCRFSNRLSSHYCTIAFTLTTPQTMGGVLPSNVNRPKAKNALQEDDP